MIELLKERYELIQKQPRVFKIEIDSKELISTISYIFSTTNFITLSQIACTDWIEDEVFALNYILTTDKRDKNLMIETTIGRDGDSIPTLMNLSPQAEVMERDLHEMYGIEFNGNPTLYDFALEDWQEIPPLRREFDTLEYVNSNFGFRAGREDNRDVKAEIKRRRAEAKRLKNAKK
jgi:NADH-quinone oxidoreductase subunit C